MIANEPPQPPRNLILDNPLWQTSLALWADESIAESCLELQASGFTVSRILTAIWLAAQDIAWDGVEPEGVRQWRHHYTETYRQLRTGLRKDNAVSAALRKQTQAAELAAEKIELAWIYHGLTAQNVKFLEINPPNEGHIPLYTRYNTALLFANLDAAAPDVSTPLQGDHGMTQLTNTLLRAAEAADETAMQPQTGSPR